MQVSNVLFYKTYLQQLRCANVMEYGLNFATKNHNVPNKFSNEYASVMKKEV